MQGHIYHSTFYTAGVSGLILADRCIVSSRPAGESGQSVQSFGMLDQWPSGCTSKRF